MSNQQQTPRTVNIKCRQRGCTSMTAKVAMEHPNGPRMYVCTKCNTPQGVSVGELPGFATPRPPTR